MIKFNSSNILFVLDIIVILFSPFTLWKFTYSLLFSDSSPFMGDKVADLAVPDFFNMLIISAIVLFVYHFVFMHFIQSVSSVVSFVINRKGYR
ncbi:hypothetical protein P0G01_001524 [Salmonella enterica]|nr:hypothetical protein [Salmonella enterica]